MNSQDIPGKLITLEALEKMFNNLKEERGLELSHPLLWGFFFTHNDKETLENCFEELEKMGLRYVKIFLSEKENAYDPDMYWLHVEKEEVHNAQSLDFFNDELYLFANEQGLDSYDGMDVSPLPY